jgi:4'-phosphopantetheinyl transferase
MDWRLGRWTAKRAVAAYLKLMGEGKARQEIEVRPAVSGAPEVFLNNQMAHISISISHRAGIAACAVAPGDAKIGCDLELIEPRSAAFLSDYFTAAEQAHVAQALVCDRDKLTTLLWSAKESALKALQVGLRWDTRSVSVSLPDASAPSAAGIAQRMNHPSSSGALALVEGWLPLKVLCSEDCVFRGWWQRSGELTRTVVCTPAANVPSVLQSEDERTNSINSSCV